MQKNFVTAIVAAAVLLVVIIGFTMRFGGDDAERDVASVRRQAPAESARDARGPIEAPKFAPATADSGQADMPHSRNAEERKAFEARHKEWLDSRRKQDPSAPIDLPKQERNSNTPSAAMDAIRRKNDLTELETILSAHEDPDERASAAFFLGSSDEEEAIPILERGLQDPDPEVRLAVVESLGDLSEYLSPSALAGAIRDPDPEVRLEAVTVLGDMETPEACELSKIALGDTNEEVRTAAEGLCE